MTIISNQSDIRHTLYKYILVPGTCMKSVELNLSLRERIQRIRGQVEGVERMISADKYCIDIINQIHAARRALDRMALMLIENHVKTCVKTALTEKKNAEPMIEELTKTLDQFLK